MKKICLAFCIVTVVACNNNGTSDTSGDTTITNISGIENVNGNLPDTINTISVEGSQTGDVTKDSSLKK